MKDLGSNQRFVFATLLAMSVILAGCRPQPKTAEQQDAEIRQKSAEATATIKEGAKQTAEATKNAATDAGRKLNAVAEGVKDGLQSGSGRMDLNSASEANLVTLPGIGETKAKQIVKARPYDSTHDLVAKGILSQSQYERISERITAK